MKVMIAGGSGFLGNALATLLKKDGHEVIALTRHAPKTPDQIRWDGKTNAGWGKIVNDMDVVVNLSGFGMEHWPWTQRQKQRFHDSCVLPGLALASAINESTRRPKIFVQQSGINYYGLRSAEIADETTHAADDFLAQLAVQWEAATKSVEDSGVRRIVLRTAVVLDARRGLFPLMALPARLFFGGRLGSGKQAVPWIHCDDWVNALVFLLKSDVGQGVYNLIAPQPVSNEDFMRAVARALRRPYWFHVPAFLMKLGLGEMSSLVLEGRFSRPKRLTEAGYRFQFPALDDALKDLFG